MLSTADFRGLWAIIPTPAKPGSDAYDAVDTVDLNETRRLVESLIGSGVEGLVALGTTGECATLTQPEYEGFVTAVLDTAARRVPTIIGTSSLGAHESVRRSRFAGERGADGILLGLPMWQPCTHDMAVRYYGEFSRLFPDLAIMVYANARAFRFNFAEPAFWRALLDAAPTVVAAKYSRAATLLPLLEATNGRIHFLPNDGAVHSFMELSPKTTTACWSTAASMGPEPARAIIDAILAGDTGRAKAVDADIAWANAPIKHIVNDPDLFASYNIQTEKTRINAAGYTNCGPSRPPYDVFPADLEAASAECGRRWKELRVKYALGGVR